MVNIDRLSRRANPTFSWSAGGKGINLFRIYSIANGALAFEAFVLSHESRALGSVVCAHNSSCFNMERNYIQLFQYDAACVQFSACGVGAVSRVELCLRLTVPRPPVFNS